MTGQGVVGSTGTSALERNHPRRHIAMNYKDHHPVFSDLPSKDKMGFAVPKTPAHSLMLLNSYMRTDLLRHIHLLLHQMRDENEPGSPLDYLARSLEQVIVACDGRNLSDRVTCNPFHIDPDYEFQPEQNYLQDIRLMKHHRKCHRRTIKDLDRYR